VTKNSVHLTITIQSSGAQRRFDHPVLYCLAVWKVKRTSPV